MEESSLDRLAHIANLSHELHQMDRTIKNEADAEFSGAPKLQLVELQNQNADALAMKPRRVACTCCRQQKAKCDAHLRHPLPCTRCTRKHLSCEVVADFKRTEKRARLANIERELAEFKKTLPNTLLPSDALKLAAQLAAGASLASPSPLSAGLPSRALDLRLVTPQVPFKDFSAPPAVPMLRDSVPEANFVLQTAPEPRLHQTPTYFAEPFASEIAEQTLNCGEKTLESITLDSQTIRSLFLEYVHKYHPIMPVVDVSKGPERIYRLCPSLFWVIMFVALRRHNSDKSLLISLSPLVKNILAEITISPITRYNPTEEDEPIMNACSVYSVQAFILYSLWPPITSSLSADSSWNTIGVALFQAIRIGLHSSGRLLEQERMNPTSPQQYAMAQEQTKTWILCNIVSQNIATAFGFPAFVQFDFHAAQHCDISISSRHIMEIAHFEDQVASTLAMTSYSESISMHINEKISLLKVLLKQLDDLEIKLLAESNLEDGHRKFQYLLARIHLLTCYFLDSKSLPPLELSRGLVRLFNASIALIHHVEMCEAKYKDFVKYLPAVSILHIWQASCFIVRLANSPFKSVIDPNAAKETYLTAIKLVARASVLKHDIAHRASGIMRNMWSFFRTLDEKNMAGLDLKIKSRMTASVFFDCLSLLRDKVGMAKLTMNTDVRENSAENGTQKEESGDLYDEYDNGSGEEAVLDSEDETDHAGRNASEITDPKSVSGESQRTTPGSNGSSARIRKKRTLSGVQDAESSARKIIRTIPLDPQPISASSGSSFRPASTSNKASPTYSLLTENLRAQNPEMGVRAHTSMSPPTRTPIDQAQNLEYASKKDLFDSLALLELNQFDTNHDLLWKDVDSLMNDFGFHT